MEDLIKETITEAGVEEMIEEEHNSSDAPPTRHSHQLTELLGMSDKFKEALHEFDGVPDHWERYLKLIYKSLKVYKQL